MSPPPPRLRMAVAQASGAVARLTIGPDKNLTERAKLAELRAISTDPAVFGHVLGPYLAEEPPTRGARLAAELLRLVGADEQVAEENAQWQRERLARMGAGGPVL